MTAVDLKSEIEIELESMELIVAELIQLYSDVSGNDPSLREKTAAGAFLAHFYNGVENILKRICSFHNVPLPEGANWHMSLFKYFCSPPKQPLPALFDGSLSKRLAPYRNFRHLFFHSYGYYLDWRRMEAGIYQIDEVFLHFKNAVFGFLSSDKSMKG